MDGCGGSPIKNDARAAPVGHVTSVHMGLVQGPTCAVGAPAKGGYPGGSIGGKADGYKLGCEEALEVTAADDGEATDADEVVDGLLSGVLRFSLEAKGWLTFSCGVLRRGCLRDGDEGSPSSLLFDLALFGDSLKGLKAGLLVVLLAMPSMLDSILLQA